MSNIGSWMQDVGESWLMTTLTLSPVLVALVETAGRQLTGRIGSVAGRGTRGHRRSTPLADLHAGVDGIVTTAMGLIALTYSTPQQI